MRNRTRDVVDPLRMTSKWYILARNAGLGLSYAIALRGQGTDREYVLLGPDGTVSRETAILVLHNVLESLRQEQKEQG